MEKKWQFVNTVKSTPLKSKTVLLALVNPNVSKNLIANERLGHLEENRDVVVCPMLQKKRGRHYFWVMIK